MPWALVRHAMRRRPAPRLLRFAAAPRDRYDVVIVGGGGHGLAIAHHLAARHNIRNVAVFEKGWLAGGNTARNTAIVRSNYLSPEAIAFYARSLDIFRGLSRELEFNLLYSERGHLTLAHSDADCHVARWRAQTNRHLGIDSDFVGREEIAKICPPLSLSRAAARPILGALWHPPGAIVRHDAVAWGYAIRAAQMGVDILPQTPVRSILRENDEAIGIVTAKGERVFAGAVVQAVAGASAEVAAMAGVRLPIRAVPLQAMATQPLAPFLDRILASSSLHVYASQTSRGELVIGGAVDPYPRARVDATIGVKRRFAADLLELLPQAAGAKILRQWAGVADMTPDYAPIMGLSPRKNYYLDAGWGTWGFKATPAAGEAVAQTVADARPPALIAPFALSRFARGGLLGERAAAAVGH